MSLTHHGGNCIAALPRSGRPLERLVVFFDGYSNHFGRKFRSFFEWSRVDGTSIVVFYSGAELSMGMRVSCRLLKG